MRSEPSVTPWKIRLIDTPEMLPAVEALQRAVWPGSDAEIVPGHVLLTAAHNGGLVAGAWAGETLVGFVFGFLGFHEHNGVRALKHCSHMLGVHPDWRSAGIGFALKRFQRGYVLRQGINHITWTFDPLLARNAHLNIAKLGAVCNTYRVNLYGDLADGLNRGLPTDRLQVDWWIATPWVDEHLSGDPAPRPSVAAHLAAGALALNPPGASSPPILPAAPAALAPLPAVLLLDLLVDFQALKTADRDLALRWRLGVRDTLSALFARRYVICDFLYEPGPPARAAYILTHTHLCSAETTS